jgi:hypothetical protein
MPIDHLGSTVDPLAKAPRASEVDGAELHVTKRDALVTKGTAREVAENIVWFHNDRLGEMGMPAISRDVLGPTEAKGVAEEIAGLPKAKAKQVLRALSKWITEGGGCLFVKPQGEKYFDALAANLGVTASFTGRKAAPPIDT